MPIARLTSVLTALSIAAMAQPVVIRDVVRIGAGNQPFNGMLTITAPAFSRAGVTYRPAPVSYNIANGVVSLTLAATAAGTVYQVRWEARPSGTTYTERWYVPESATPLTVADVSVALPLPPSVTELPPAQISPSGGAVGDVLTVLPTGRGGWAAPVSGSGTAGLEVVFADATLVTLTHNLNTRAGTVVCRDAGRAILAAGAITYTTANAVEIRFLPAQSGTCAFVPASTSTPAAERQFVGATSITIDHWANSYAVDVVCLDAANAVIEPGAITYTSFQAVAVQFEPAQTGVCWAIPR